MPGSGHRPVGARLLASLGYAIATRLHLLHGNQAVKRRQGFFNTIGLPSASGLQQIRGAADTFRTREPFPHCTVDGVVDRRELLKLRPLLPDFQHCPVQLLNSREVSGVAVENRWSQLPPLTRHLVAKMAAPPFVNALQEASGLDRLVLDQNLTGAGIFLFRSGAHMLPHAEHGMSEVSGLRKAVSLWLCLDTGSRLQPSPSVTFQLWSHDLSKPEVLIDPSPGGALVIGLGPTAFVGVSTANTYQRREVDSAWLKVTFQRPL